MAVPTAATPETVPYWQGVDAGELRFPVCDDCGRAHFFPRAFCPHCWSESLHWEVARGLATVASFVESQHAPADFDLETPYVIAIVELDAGPRLLTNIVGSTRSAVRVGMRVRLVVDPIVGLRPGPRFEPVEPS